MATLFSPVPVSVAVSSVMVVGVVVILLPVFSWAVLFLELWHTFLLHRGMLLWNTKGEKKTPSSHKHSREKSPSVFSRHYKSSLMDSCH
ncbi:hypothetical protein Dimus_011235 [Dionaea muscipula]